MPEVSDPLYNTALLRLAADATGAGRLDAPTHRASLANPACGDRVSVEIATQDGRLAALAHQTQACVITQASAAILGRVGPGMDAAGLAKLESQVRAMLKDGAPPPLADYAAFTAAAALPGRHACVLLPLRAALQALEE